MFLRLYMYAICIHNSFAPPFHSSAGNLEMRKRRDQCKVGMSSCVRPVRPVRSEVSIPPRTELDARTGWQTWNSARAAATAVAFIRLFSPHTILCSHCAADYSNYAAAKMKCSNDRVPGAESKRRYTSISVVRLGGGEAKYACIAALYKQGMYSDVQLRGCNEVLPAHRMLVVIYSGRISRQRQSRRCSPPSSPGSAGGALPKRYN